ncbi:thiamine pyrophosphate-binding protein [Limnochorda pilosa]|uniref:Acetolactate synthase n=1 Tax=Limnochorda pilosa TaxID=1555112 RepID=A0A0K2SN65_LIMPI|nr:thiamine pyrophosphate-binding protein [Limnochorda pilosa]BAS28259.1 acetolactate synthase [Limnochorda pilosa]
MTGHGGRLVARVLRNHGAEVLFTLCGGHIQAIYDGCLDEGIRVVDLRHEQSAVFAADAWSRLTGRVGAAAVTAGPGVTNAITAVANAWRAQSPVVVLGGAAPQPLMGKGALQEADLVPVLAPISKASYRITRADRLADQLDEAFRLAAEGVPGPVYVEVPVDLLFDSAPLPDPLPLAPRTPLASFGPGRLAGHTPLAPDPEAVAQAVHLLEGSRSPVALVGSQLRWHGDPDLLARWAQRFQLPVYLNGMARGALPQDSPHLFARTRKAALAEADVAVVVGTPLDFRLGYGQSPVWDARTRLIRIDLDPAQLHRNRRADAALAADAGAALAAMLDAAASTVGGPCPSAPAPSVSGSDTPPAARARWLERLRRQEEEKAAGMESSLRSTRTPLDPLRVAAEVDAALEPGSVVVGDGGDFVATAAAVVQPRRWPGGWLDPGPLGTLGIGTGFAVAARLAFPESPVLALFGDGSVGFNLADFEAAARQGLPFVAVVGNDGAWTQIRRGQVQMYGAERAVATGLTRARYERAVEALGGWGAWVERPDELAPALRQALASGRPALVNVAIAPGSFRAGAISI